ncbi:acyltransferase family protein [Sphaerisporangium corydalis]|uniref:Acyltransferase family protein n=1 Tax=Sphaerisporangium corydalis TaxID=1441875 RepID=A0ABV9EEG8_9ACTN|nr:acyltransferase [Sphaerisporangium corydalis]
MELTKPVGSRPVALPSRLPSLTGMRFISAAMVFLTHALGANLFASADFTSTYTMLVVQGGWAAVCYFFILSGFVLTYAQRSTDTPKTFLRRRFLKIYPNYAITLIAALILVSVVAKTAIDGKVAFLHFALLQAYFPTMDIRIAFNSPAWSLSCEALFYLCFPLLARYIVRIRPERLWAWTGAVVAVIFAVPLLSKLLPAQPPIPGFGMTESTMWFIMQFPPVRMLEFIFGMLMARIVMTGRKLPLSLGGSVALGIALYALSPLFPLDYNVVATSIVPLGLIIAAGAVRDSQGRTNWLGSRPMIKLGEWSYAFYMWHYLILIYARQWFGSPKGWSTPAGFGMLGVLFLITLGLSYLLFTLVEDPIMKRFASSKKRPRHSVSPPPPPPISGLDSAPKAEATAGATGAPTTAS